MQTFGDNVTLDEEEFAEILKVMEDEQVCVCDTCHPQRERERERETERERFMEDGQVCVCDTCHPDTHTLLTLNPKLKVTIDKDCYNHFLGYCLTLNSKLKHLQGLLQPHFRLICTLN